MNRELLREISEVGADIIDSSPFEELRSQEHHFRTTVADHSVHVAYMSVILCEKLEKAGIPVDRRAMIRGSLAHDLGLLGRYTGRYKKTNLCFLHPINSVEAYKSFCDEVTEIEEDIIRHHMWPATFFPPKTIEGIIITIADKICAVAESFGSEKRSKLADQV